MDLREFTKHNSDLFMLKLPTYNNILVDILQNDDLDKFIQLMDELFVYLYIVSANYKDPFNIKVYEYVLNAEMFNDDAFDTFEFDEVKYKKDKKEIIKNLKNKWKFLISQNLKSDSCKIIRFLTTSKIHGVYKHILVKLSRKFTDKQRILISEASLYHKTKFGMTKTILEKLIIEPSIRKTTTLDEIHIKREGFLNRQNAFINHYRKTTLKYNIFSDNQNIFGKEVLEQINFKILNKIDDIRSLPVKFIKFYFDLIIDLLFIIN